MLSAHILQFLLPQYYFFCFLQAPNERARLYFLLAWFHAVIQERLRYAPLGWSKKYEFGESDLRSACDTIDTWLDDTAKVGGHCRNHIYNLKHVQCHLLLIESFITNLT